MKILSRIPLYLGLTLLVVAVLFSAIKVGQTGQLTNLASRATTSGANLTLRFSAPDLVSVAIEGEGDVAGIDIVIRFDTGKLHIIPSTLASGPDFTTSGGIVDETASTFAFSALAKGENVKTGIIATFRIQSANVGATTVSELMFVRDAGQTAVIGKEGSENILTQDTGVTVTVQ